MATLTNTGVLLRLIFAVLLVFLSYNPSGYSYTHWVMHVLDAKSHLSVVVLAGIVLLIGWVIYIRATINSLGVLGVSLFTLLFGAIVWLLIDFGLFDWRNVSLVTWVVLVLIAGLLTVGMCWSHIRRRLSGQLDTNDVED